MPDEDTRRRERERKAKQRAKNKASGLVRLEIAVHPDDRAVLRRYAEKLAARRKTK